MHYDYALFAAALSARIRSIRQQRGLTQMNMVQQYGYHLADWQGIEKGRRMSLRLLVRVANTFEVPVSELVAGIDWQEGPGFGSRGFTPPPGSDVEPE